MLIDTHSSSERACIERDGSPTVHIYVYYRFLRVSTHKLSRIMQGARLGVIEWARVLYPSMMYDLFMNSLQSIKWNSLADRDKHCQWNFCILEKSKCYHFRVPIEFSGPEHYSAGPKSVGINMPLWYNYNYLSFFLIVHFPFRYLRDDLHSQIFKDNFAFVKLPVCRISLNLLSIRLIVL